MSTLATHEPNYATMPHEAPRSRNLIPNEKPYPTTKSGRGQRLAAATEYDSRETPKQIHRNQNCNQNYTHPQNTKPKMRFGHRRRNVAYIEQCPEISRAGATKMEPEPE